MNLTRTAVAAVAAIYRPNRTGLVTRDGYLGQVRLAGKEKAMFRNAVITTIGVLVLLLWPTAPVVAQQNAPFQLKVTGSCAAGSSIRIINADGSVVCQVDSGAGVTDVTASAPLSSSGGTTPNISLPDVNINGAYLNTAIGPAALVANTSGSNNTASGFGALASNTSGSINSASGAFALVANTTGRANTASGASALFSNTEGIANTASGYGALGSNTTGVNNTASGYGALFNNTSGGGNTASGVNALRTNTTGNFNTAIGHLANVASTDLSNATAIGANAGVDASNKIRLGDANVSVIEGNVAYTFTSDKNQKENFQPVDGKDVLRKLRGFNLTSWNYIGHDPKEFRHYGPVAQEFFAAFGHDGIGTAGSPTTINSGDLAGILMSAVQELAKQNLELKSDNAAMRSDNAAIRARLDSLEQLIRSDNVARVVTLVEK